MSSAAVPTPGDGLTEAEREALTHALGLLDTMPRIRATVAAVEAILRDRAPDVAAIKAEALREAADEADSFGHHWSGACAVAFFTLAEDLHSRADALAAER